MRSYTRPNLKCGQLVDLTKTGVMHHHVTTEGIALGLGAKDLAMGYRDYDQPLVQSSSVVLALDFWHQPDCSWTVIKVLDPNHGVGLVFLGWEMVTNPDIGVEQ